MVDIKPQATPQTTPQFHLTPTPYKCTLFGNHRLNSGALFKTHMCVISVIYNQNQNVELRNMSGTPGEPTCWTTSISCDTC